MEECLVSVEKLVLSPELLLEMKKANNDYYLTHLIPDQMIENTLKIVLGSDHCLVKK